MTLETGAMRFSKEFKYNHVIFGIVLCLVFYAFYNISFTDDYIDYENHYETNKIMSYSDVGFITLEEVSHEMNLNFREFVSLTLLLQIILYSIIFIKFKVNPSVCLIFLILINYVQIANQLRYYLAFPTFIIAAYYLLYRKKRIIGILLSVASFLLHSGVVVMMAFYPIYFFVRKKQISIRKLIVFYLVVGVICLLGFESGLNFITNIDAKYVAYTKSVASLLGMLFVLLTPLYYYFVIIILNRRVDLKREDSLLGLLIALSLFSIIWVVVSLTGLQIINARFVNSFIILWIACIYRLVMLSNFHHKGFTFCLILIGGLIIKYVLPFMLFGHSDFDKLCLIFMSKYI